MKHERKRPLGSWWRREALQTLPVPSCGGYRLEITGDKGEESLFISGVKRILVCTDDEVLLALPHTRLLLLGEGLVLLTYEGGMLEVRGRLKELSFGGKGAE